MGGKYQTELSDIQREYLQYRQQILKSEIYIDKTSINSNNWALYTAFHHFMIHIYLY